MSESNDEEVSEVSEEFKHLFQGLRFKFEGLTPETEEEFVEVVQEMGAKVSKNARISLVHRSYFEEKKASRRVNLYNIDYIADSVREGKALDLKNYKFILDDELSDDEPLCYTARYMYNTDSCQECYYTKVFCKECAKDSIKESLRVAKQNRNNIVSATDSSSEDEITNSPDQDAVRHNNESSKNAISLDSEQDSDDEIMNSPDQETVGCINKPSKRVMSSDSEQDSTDDEQNKSSCAEKSPVRKKMKNSSNFDNTSNIEESPEIDIENDSECTQNQSNGTSVNNSQKEPVEEETNSIFGTIHDVIEPTTSKPRKNGVTQTTKDDSLSDVASDCESNTINNKDSLQTVNSASGSGWIKSSKPKIAVKTERPELPKPEPLTNGFLDIFNEDEEQKYFQGENWWKPQDVPEDERCPVVSCSFEPTDHRVHYPFRKFLSLVEKKILVKYLINSNGIHNAKGKNIYQSMIKDGYLTHRTWETLRNCFRRTIINEVEGYKLNRDIIDQFIKLRRKNVRKV